MDLKGFNSKSRFSSRAKNYNKYRPSYPSEVISFLTEAIGLNKCSFIADIGSGTGISTRIFLDNGNTVYSVEPNEDMRQIAERLLNGYSNFYSVAGSSESTNLQSESIDVIVAAQSFHWFDLIPTKNEFLRILKPNGFIVLLYNIRRNNSVGFMGEYLSLIKKYGEKYINESDDDFTSDFFADKTVYEKVLHNPQIVDFEGLKGNLVSYSYMPNEDDPNFITMISELRNLFNKYNKDGKVILEYDTCISYCKMK
ncbi:class I SAM-dependent methyltransferase [uncultured Clostridium sp.]|uniref:class I SAM-dependent methyltransferase n=1 Tax=uncultured Clostridium sp. TaxID=59620 RepID=UPI0028E7C07E|nr:class I SAM-dependent methyltransferase [uncultured Clostridium sp.]